MSHVLKRNQFPAGSRELPTDEGALNKIIIRRVHPHAEPVMPIRQQSG